MSNEKYALGIDFGTQSVRSIVFNDKGEVLFVYKEIYEQPYFSKENGYAEQWPDYYFDKFCKTTKALCQEHPEIIPHLLGCSISCFRDTAVLLDENYKVLRPSILWLDQRQAECKNQFPLIPHTALFLARMLETAKINAKRTASNWINENEHDLWMKTKHYWALSTYFIYRLTSLAHDTPSSYTGHYPINMKKKRWQNKNEITNSVFNIDKSLLPELKEPGSLLGTISEVGSKLTSLPVGFKIYGGGGDKSCETLGGGAIDNSIASISYGTACSIEIVSSKYHEPETFLPAYVAPNPGLYNMEIQIYRGYWMLEWFAKNFASEEINAAVIEQRAVEDVLNNKMNEIPPGSDGLVLQPYWGPGLKRPLAKGVIVGFSDYHTKYHLYRAIIEGLAFALKEGLVHMEKKRGSKVKLLNVSGGGSKSSAICQITADIFDLPVRKVQTYETASLGAAIIVFVSSNHYKDYKEAVSNMVHQKEIYYPNPQTAKVYKEIYENIYEKIYPQIKGINYSIQHLTRKLAKERKNTK